uniref:Uncharacterized protein n=1 Tax=Branchiostoma floridae TaxID=7739 RepID=C3XSW9_BRAFL|eukprot:XP_002612828.1 hypothetical protein BRAFLDRAFT_67224 [Branchiostoma floridae]
MYEQAEPVRSPVSGPGSGRTTGPPPQSPTVHLSASKGRARYGKGAADKREEDQETSDTYEEAEAVKRDTTYTSAGRMYMGASVHQALCSFIRSHRICLAAVTVTVVVFSLVAMGLFIMFFINNKEKSELTVTVNNLKLDLENMSQRDVDNEQNQTAATESFLGTSKMPASLSVQSLLEQLQSDMQQLQVETKAKEQRFQAEIQQLQAETGTKEHMFQSEIQQLHTEMAAKDQMIHDLQQRSYVERCESGFSETPRDAFTSGHGDRHRDLTTTFSRAFRTTPVVTVGLTTLDHLDDENKDGDGNIRVTAGVLSVSTTSLKIKVDKIVHIHAYLKTYVVKYLSASTVNMYEQAEPVRSPVSGPGSGRTTGPPPQSPTVHLSASRGRARYGKGATDKGEEDQETSSTYEEAEEVKRDTTYTSADHMCKGGATGCQAFCSFIRFHRICMAAAVVVVLIAMGLFIMFFINNKEISQLTVTINDLKLDLENLSQRDIYNERNQTAAMDGMSKKPVLLSMEDVIEQLLQQQAMIQQLQIEMAAKDQKTKVLEQNAQAFRQEIKALQQRSIYRCE